MWQKIFLTVLVIFAAAKAVSAGNRVALVIGNGEYTDDKAWRTLRNPPNDAASISKALRKLGFTVLVHTDLAKVEMRSVIAEFGRKAYQAEVAVFFFAGHGIQNKSQNFLMPTDVKAYSLADAVDQGINLNLALEELDNAQSEIKIVMLDACRENPYSNEYRGTKSGLAPVDVTNNMIIVYSTQPGNIAADRVGGGKNSPFTSSLVEALQSRDLSLGNVLKVTSKLVKQKTGKQQVPYVNGPRDLDDFMLAGEPVAVENDAPPVLPVEARQPFEPEMVDIPAGIFEMGSPSNEEDRYDDEGPVHTVHVKAFQMGKYEITRGQFRAFVNASGYKTEAETGDGCYGWTGSSWEKKPEFNWRNVGFEQNDKHPVVCVSWNDSQKYIAWLNNETGKNYRLPTEAEWEYAARAGTTTARYWGNNPDQACQYSNVADQASKRKYNWSPIHECDDSYVNTAPVGQFQPNDFGLYDMLGNVWEWNQDKWHSNYTGAPTDGSAWEADDSNLHLLRGGSWFSRPDNCRSALRFNLDNSYYYYGVRVVAVVSP